MANRAIVSYAFTGSKESLEKIVSAMDYNMNLWDVLSRLGISTEDLYLRGYICEFEMTPDALRVECNCAWDEASDWRHAIKKAFPDVKVYYYVEEPGNCIYATNDSEGRFYATRYIIDTYGCDIYHKKFGSLHYLKMYLSEVFGMPMHGSVKECNESLEKHISESDSFGDADAHIYEVEIRND